MGLSRPSKKEAEKEAELKAKKEELLLGLQEDYSKGIDHVIGLRNDRLRDFLKYFFEVKVTGLGTKKREDELRKLVRDFMEEKQSKDGQ